MLETALLLIAVLWLAYGNGANDNFKGVATLYGSATAGFRTALAWCTVTTLAGALVSVAVAQGLVATFSGKGLIPDDVLAGGALVSVSAAAAATIFLATLLGMPTSTTHALTGALVGVGLAAAPSQVGWSVLGGRFAIPLLLSPLMAIVGTAALYVPISRLRGRLGITSRTCVCIGREAPQPVQITADGRAATLAAEAGPVTIAIDETTRCVERYDGKVVGVGAQQAVDAAHWASAGAVCFARAVNDTPKIAALLLAGTAVVGTNTALVLVAAVVVVGGLIQSRRVAETMSHKITDLNTGQGLMANLVTAGLVLGASRLGVPVSTTHVTCGSIFGISAVNGKRRWGVIAAILATWVTTLPLALALGAAAYLLLS